MTEDAVTFGNHRSLVGIAARPHPNECRSARTAIILLNAGIVHRVGPGRIYVKLARALASIGLVALRFDFSGIGDSPIRTDNMQFEESAVAEAQEAMDFMAMEGIEDFILLGGCSGARAALNTACRDHRVKGALLINYPTMDDDSDDESHMAVRRSAFFYYRKSALFNSGSWIRWLTGKANYKQLARSIWWKTSHTITSHDSDSPQAAQFRLRLQRIVHRKVRAVFICSEGDHRLDDLRTAGGRQLKRMCASGAIALQIIKGSDHTFSSLYDQTQLITAVLEHVGTIMGADSQSMANSATVEPARALSHQLQF